MLSSTSRRVFGEIERLPLITYDTVLGATPAAVGDVVDRDHGRPPTAERMASKRIDDGTKVSDTGPKHKP